MISVEILIPLFFLTALLYSMAGFGGGSTYLALLVLFSVSYQVIPSTALICNIIVVSGGCYYYIKNKQFSLNLVLPFLITSIPLAFVGGSIPLNKSIFMVLLGLSLLIASFRMFITEKQAANTDKISKKKVWSIGLISGAILGLLSGLTGIGGGIYLAPTLYFLGWGKPRTIAASASFFILANSIAGLSGQLLKNSFLLDWNLITPLAFSVFLGGQVGSRLSSQKLNLNFIKKLTASLILFVSVRILYQTLF
ncbi:MAG: sulfite exporter TauE/SafE family protein [Deltaproteobacteria bacterium]|nr:sulfite exporter TauE/SafE family protein [Deltaproteobacteria bacterium]